LSRYFFHCSDGVDLVLDRKGVEIEASDVLWSDESRGASDQGAA
jgi:hypothetical protein